MLEVGGVGGVVSLTHPVTVPSRQNLLDEDGGAVGPVGAPPDGDAQAAGSSHRDELDDSFTRVAAGEPGNIRASAH